MGPNSGRTRSRTRTKSTARKSTRSSKQLLKKRKEVLVSSHEVQKSPSKSSTPSNTDDEFPKTEGIVFEAIDDEEEDKDIVSSRSSASSSGCSTPKGQKFRIPEIVNCPPAPKKQRVEASNCSVQRSPIAFFAPPDLELFFYFALRGISV